MTLGEVLQDLGCTDRISIGECQAGWAKKQIVEGVDLEVTCSTPGQGHLDDLELGIVRTQFAPQSLLILDRKTGVLGKEHGLCSLDTLLDIGDSLDLLWSWHVSSSSNRTFASYLTGR